MESNKYYTPDIEDLYIGYKCEVDTRLKGAYDPKLGWDNHIPEYEPFVFDSSAFFIINLQLGQKLYRTKYLDKEDIESLGWVHNNRFYYSWSNEEIEVPEISSRDLKFQLNYVDNEHSVKIEFYESNHFEWFTCFEGQIKSINELKVLMRMLQIK